MNPMKTARFLLIAFVCTLGVQTHASEPTSAVESTAGEAPPDGPGRMIKAKNPRFPDSLLKEGVTHGTVNLLVHIDKDGEKVDHLITAATRQAFVRELERSLRTWKFAPSRVGGRAIAPTLDLTITFDAEGVSTIEKLDASMPAAPQPIEAPSLEFRTHSVREFDAKPTAVSITQPVDPEAWCAQSIAGSVTVLFYIDETGKVRIPVVLETSHDYLGAVAAVAKWRFTPPTAKGKPVLTRVRQTLSFGTSQPADSYRCSGCRSPDSIGSWGNVCLLHAVWRFLPE